MELRIIIDNVIKSLITSFLFIICILFYNQCVLYGMIKLDLSFIRNTNFRIGIVYIICLIIFYLYYNNSKIFLNNLFKYRFLIAVVLFIFLVLLKVTGSSIGMFCSCFGEMDSEVILGKSRPIRSDEWAVSTPMLWAQYQDDHGTFSYFSSVVRGDLTDVFLEYGQPVKTIFMIFRPFYIGYLFLPIDNGMAFFWCGRLIALFMSSFEFGRLITEDDRKISVVYAFMITFAPVVQWWFAINGLVEMLICIQLSIVLYDKYLKSDIRYKKLIYFMVILILAGTYILTMYPSWQVPFVYVLIGLIIWKSMENYDKNNMKMIDWLSIIVGVAILMAMIIAVLLKSKETIELITNTVYPGARSEKGGGLSKELFGCLSNVWFAIKEQSPYGNVCEAAMFLDLFPLSWIYFAYNMVKNKKRDRLLIILFGVSLFLGIWCVVGFPDLISKITLMSNSQPGRTIVVFGFANTIMLFRAIALYKKTKNNFINSIVISVIITAVIVGITFDINRDYYSIKMLSFMGIICFMMIFGVWHLNVEIIKSVWSFLILTVIMISGLLVNPIRSGVDDIYYIPELRMVDNIQEADPEALWVASDINVNNNLLLLVGAPTINSTNVYPDMKRWHLLDKTGEYEYIYNRYAHITVNVVDKDDDEDIFQEGYAPDQFILNVTDKELDKLGVKYIFTQNGELDSNSFQQLDSEDGYYVYRLIK